jgi:hypothetical protein
VCQAGGQCALFPMHLQLKFTLQPYRFCWNWHSTVIQFYVLFWDFLSCLICIKLPKCKLGKTKVLKS